MLDQTNRGHVLTLHDSLQQSISLLQQYHILDSDLQVIIHQSPNSSPFATFASLPTDNAIKNNKASRTATLNNSFHTLMTQLYEKNQKIILDAINFANDIKNRRQSSLKDFHETLATKAAGGDSSIKLIDDVVIIPSSHGGKGNMSSIQMKRSNDEQQHLIYLTQLQFKRNYLYSNKPCIIHNLNEDEFKTVSNKWVKHETSINEEGEQSQSVVNTDWFLSEIGASTIVPVRKMPNQNMNAKANTNTDTDGDLDEDGRAVECETIEMTMKDWIDTLSTCQNVDVNSTNIDSTLYLKDWHLQKILEDKWTTTSQSQLHNKLYEVPRIFDGDLFNPFLLNNGGGDYRFVYWGPNGSFTSIHSDVLHSFSWSFNVVGEKKWIFYTPHLQLDGMDGKDHQTFEIKQRTGETIYVPSRWKHSVHNLRETLSINHNWITPSTLDEMYECILCEIRAIDKELSEWGMTLNYEDEDEEENDCIGFGNLESFRMREDMLRGCVGMDVTSFCVMLTDCLSNCLVNLYQITSDTQNGDQCTYHELLWERWFDFTCTMNILQFILDENGQKSFHIQRRLCAMLGKQVGVKSYALMRNLENSCNSLIIGLHTNSS